LILHLDELVLLPQIHSKLIWDVINDVWDADPSIIEQEQLNTVVSVASTTHLLGYPQTFSEDPQLQALELIIS